MYSFDKGRIVATAQDGTVTEFRQAQEFSIDFKQTLKSLFGRGQDAVYVASGKREITIKGSFADITTSSTSLLLDGDVTTGINKMIDPAPTLTVPSASPYTASLTVPDSSVFKSLLPVYNVTNANLVVPMTRISSGTPTTGEFLFTATTTAGAKTYTVTTDFVANDTVVIDSVTFTAVASDAGTNEFLIGTDIEASIITLAAAISASTLGDIYTVTYDDTTITLTETEAGIGNTPSDATVTGTGVMTSGTATTSAAANTFTFAEADAGDTIQVLYDYYQLSGSTVTVSNNMMGSQLPFQLEVFTQLADSQLHFVFPRCMAAGTSYAAKMEDFTIPSIEATAMTTSADITAYVYIDNDVAQ